MPVAIVVHQLKELLEALLVLHGHAPRLLDDELRVVRRARQRLLDEERRDHADHGEDHQGDVGQEEHGVPGRHVFQHGAHPGRPGARVRDLEEGVEGLREAAVPYGRPTSAFYTCRGLLGGEFNGLLVVFA